MNSNTEYVNVNYIVNQRSSILFENFPMASGLYWGISRRMLCLYKLEDTLRRIMAKVYGDGI